MSDPKRYRVLMLHNAYQTRGGEEESAESECRALREAGHEVTYLTAHNDDIASWSDKIRAAGTLFWSRSWQQQVAQELGNKTYDVLHVQNLFPQISPSVYTAARRVGVPVVQAVRNYRLACPAATLLREGKPCIDCVGRRVKLPGLRHRCYRGSASASASIVAANATHKAIGTWQKNVDCYLAVSQYVADVLTKEGMPEEKISVKPCFTYQLTDFGEIDYADRKDVLFVGRLSEEKGLPLLLEAWRRVAPNQSKLKIIGDGALPTDLPANVEFLGKKSARDVQKAMSQAAFVVMPGLWAEPFGRVAIEAFAQGAPVIATGIGGVANIIENGVNGSLFPRADASALAEVIQEYISNPNKRRRYGLAARQAYIDFYTPAKNVEYLERVYAQFNA